MPIFSPRDFLEASYYTNTYVIGGLSGSLTALHPQGQSSVAELGYRHDFAPSRLGSASL